MMNRRETLTAEMKPDCYGGETCDQIRPRWYCYAAGDKQGDYEHEPMTLDARLFPPGTRISVEEPVCPDCGDAREPILPTPATGPVFGSKCRCGFDWEAWTLSEYS